MDAYGPMLAYAYTVPIPFFSPLIFSDFGRLGPLNPSPAGWDFSGWAAVSLRGSLGSDPTPGRLNLNRPLRLRYHESTAECIFVLTFCDSWQFLIFAMQNQL